MLYSDVVFQQFRSVCDVIAFLALEESRGRMLVLHVLLQVRRLAREEVAFGAFIERLSLECF